MKQGAGASQAEPPEEQPAPWAALAATPAAPLDLGGAGASRQPRREPEVSGGLWAACHKQLVLLSVTNGRIKCRAAVDRCR